MSSIDFAAESVDGDVLFVGHVVRGPVFDRARRASRFHVVARIDDAARLVVVVRIHIRRGTSGGRMVVDAVGQEHAAAVVVVVRRRTGRRGQTDSKINDARFWRMEK